MDSRKLFLAIESEAAKRGMTKEELCHRLHVSPSTWSNYRERPETMRLATLERACNTFMIPLWELARSAR